MESNIKGLARCASGLNLFFDETIEKATQKRFASYKPSRLHEARLEALKQGVLKTTLVWCTEVKRCQQQVVKGPSRLVIGLNVILASVTLETREGNVD